nr:glycosyltransferase family 29 protein [Fulvivirga sedimenti]
MFPASVLTNKRIAIVGPASSAYGTGKGDYIDGFDLVVRINKAALLMRDKRSPEDIGTKTDILFHSFFENEYSGGGPLDLELYERLGIKYLVNPIPTYFGHRVSFNFYKKYLRSYPVYTLPLPPYLREVKQFGKFRPTTGFCALKYLLESDFKELYIGGFTFFQTAYGDGYRDEMKSKEATQQYINKMQIHNPDIEFTEFVRIYVENRNKNVVLDEALRELVSQKIAE